jgi:hypothetical protein
MTQREFVYGLLDLIATDEIDATEVKEFLQHPNQSARLGHEIIADLKRVAANDNVFLAGGDILEFQPGVTIKPRKGLQYTEDHFNDALRYASFDPSDALIASGCCGDPVPVYHNGTWSCETCGNVDKERSAISEAHRSKNQYGIPVYTPKCECGAHSTSNANCHSTWCPRYGR